MNFDDEKGQLRTFMRGLRKAITPESRKAQEQKLAQRLLSLPAFKNARCVGVYQAYASEFDLTFVVEGMRKANPQIRIAYPAIIGDGLMRFANVAAGELPEFVANPLALINPQDHFDWIQPTDLDLLLVPALAFDANLNRLGQGGGFYDRYIPMLKDECMTIGVCYNKQIIEKVPSTTHDRRVDYVIAADHTYAR